jgi:hypothetical protein
MRWAVGAAPTQTDRVAKSAENMSDFEVPCIHAWLVFQVDRTLISLHPKLQYWKSTKWPL